MALTRRASRDTALVELQRLHAAILASRARRGVGPEVLPAPSAETIAAQELTRRLQTEATTPDDDEQSAEPRSRRGWWLAMAAAVVVAGAWAALTLSQRPEVVTEAAPPRSAPPADTGPVAAPAPAPGTASTAAPSRPAAPAKPIQVILATNRPVWLRVTVDGTRAIEREVPAGETLSFEADRTVIVRAGDAGAVQATLNGADRGALGLRGWPLTVAITPEGMSALTPTRPQP